MRTIQFFIIISIGLFLSACKKDDNRVCTRADFLGTFEGTTICANGGSSDASITVIAGSTETELEIDVSGSIFTVDVDGCNFSGSQKDSNVDLEYSGNLNGDKIEVSLRGLVFMNPFDCTATGERQ